jgi:hypothetical protein
VSRRAQHVDRRIERVLADEDVVGVERRDREDADAGLSERGEDRGEDAGQREVDRTGDAQRAPAALARASLGTASAARTSDIPRRSASSTTARRAPG